MIINCLYDELKPIHKITKNPSNANKHSKDQIERLAKIIDNVGMRMPLIISKRSGFLVKGHGTLEALKFLGEESAPVSYQEFDNEAQEYAFLIADNEIARWAEFDVQQLKMDLPKFEDLDIDLLGIKEFQNVFLEELNDVDEDIEEEKEDNKKESLILEVTFPDIETLNEKYEELINENLIVKKK